MSASLDRPQSFANHRALPSPAYLLAGLVLAVEFGHRAWIAYRHPAFWNLFAGFLGVALLVVWYASRRRAQIVQDRVIRLEMQLRLERLLGPARRGEIARLALDHLVALRFASDAELPALVGAVLEGELASPDDIKRRVKDWQADWLRV